jgi:sodium/pantothenate symporter
MAAALSSASTFLSLIGFSVSNDIVVRKQALTLRASRIAMFATGAAVLVLCFIFPPNVFWLMMFIGTVFASSWGPVGFMSIWSKSITADAAFWGILSGFFGNVIPASLEYMGLISLPSYFNPALIGASISLLTIIFISRRGNVTTQEAEYREYLHRTPDVDYDLQKTKTTLWAPAFLVIYGCVMPLLLIKYYVIPYQTALGQLLPDGTVDLSTGESVLAMLTAPVYIILALIVTKVVWTRYSPRPQTIT